VCYYPRINSLETPSLPPVIPGIGSSEIPPLDFKSGLEKSGDLKGF
jgi:hypothetical protein